MEQIEPGLMLVGKTLDNAVRQGLLFQDDTWDEKSIRSAGYDLRFDCIECPDNGGQSLPKRDELFQNTGTLRLDPGDSAFIACKELIKFDWEYAGTIGPKFSLAANGLLILSGHIIDPGYGMEIHGDGSTSATPDAKIYFGIANIGLEAIELRRGCAIASLQIFKVDIPLESRVRIANPGHELLSKLGAGPFYFMSEINKSEKQNAKLDSLGQEVRSMRVTVDSAMTKATDARDSGQQLILFGVFLVAATLFSGAMGLLLTNLGNSDASQSLFRQIGEYTLLGGLIAAAITGGIIFSVTFRAYSKSKRDSLPGHEKDARD